MLRSAYKPMLLLMWLALITSAFGYWRNWDRLPARMAVHFDANFRPNGYASREGAVEVGIGIMAVMVSLFTIAGVIAHAVKPAAAWPILLFFYVVVGVLWYGNDLVVRFNLNRLAPHPPPLNITIPQ
jgi:Protein of unknown function (DUF1648)